MSLLKTAFRRKLTIFLVATALSVSAIAAPNFNQTQVLDFNQTQVLANKGYAPFQYNLGVKYHDGNEVRQDYTKAIHWYQKAAAKGHAKALFNLGVMYDNGEGVRQNTATAKEYFGRACDNGFQGGCHNYRLLN